MVPSNGATDLQPQASRIPRPRACMPCRSSKHKCDGDEATGLPCSRCARNSRECTWAAPKRMGRPRRNMDSFPTTPCGPSSPACSSSSGVSRPLSPSNSPSASLTSTDDQLTWEDIESFLKPYENLAFDPSPPTPTTSSASTIDHVPGPDIAQLLDLFYAVPHTYLPILPPQQKLLNQFPGTTPLLLNAMLAMSLPNTLERTRTDYHIAALAILTSSPDITDPLQHIQALLILAYLEHGLGDIQRASEFRTNAADFIVGWGWNLMDAYSTPPANFGVWGSLAMAYSAVPEESFDEYADAKRKAWWECWAVDILLEATGGIKRILVDTPIAVSIPQQPEDSAPSYYPQRIRSLALLAEVMAFPLSTTHAPHVGHPNHRHPLEILREDVALRHPSYRLQPPNPHENGERSAA